MFKLFHNTVDKKVTTSFSMDDTVARYADERMVKNIMEQLTSKWIEKFGAEVIDNLAPEQMKISIEQAVKDRIAEKILR